jgi:cysteinyl-tRNA synthetase
MDIHCGGVDNIFPHHTNEIAQSEAYLGHKWCNYWFHVHHLNHKSGKMSKSKGEFLTVSLLEEKGYNPLAYRFFCLQSHYRKPLEFSYENLDNSVKAYEKLKKALQRLSREGQPEAEAIARYKEKFIEALDNDLNTSMAITVLYEVLKADIKDATKVALAESFEEVLSLGLFEEGEAAALPRDEELEAFVQAKIAERAEAKKAKDFAKADAIRSQLLEKGIELKDTREGVEWKKV